MNTESVSSYPDAKENSYEENNDVNDSEEDKKFAA